MIAIFVGFVLGFVLGFLVFVLISRDKYDAFTYAIKQASKGDIKAAKVVRDYYL